MHIYCILYAKCFFYFPIFEYSFFSSLEISETMMRVW